MNVLILGTGIFFIIYYFILTYIMGPIVFSKNLLLLGAVMVMYFVVNKMLIKNLIYLKLKKLMIPIVMICLIIFVAIESVIIGFSFTRNTDQADYMIVLGAGLRQETMTQTLRQRMEACYDYLQEYDNCKYIILSGGQGEGEAIAESEAMSRYLISKGVPADRILQEDTSTSTYENLEFSKVIIEEHSNKKISDVKVKILTSNFHSFRAYLLAQRCGYELVTSYGSPINPIFIPTYYIREFFAFFKTFVLDVIF